MPFPFSFLIWRKFLVKAVQLLISDNYKPFFKTMQNYHWEKKEDEQFLDICANNFCYCFGFGLYDCPSLVWSILWSVWLVLRFRHPSSHTRSVSNLTDCFLFSFHSDLFASHLKKDIFNFFLLCLWKKIGEVFFC